MPCINRDNVIYNVRELPEIFSVADGDLLLVETENGTSILDFENFVISADNTTFGSTLSSNTTDIATLSSSFNTLSSSVDTSIAALSSSVITSNTKAMVTLTAWDASGVIINKSSNIASAEVDGSVIRFNFISNFLDEEYLILPSTGVVNADGDLAMVVLSDRSTNFVDLSVIDITTGDRATTAANIGFKLESF
jgi:ABC-type phosphate/phosphonate transport system substrate-binding protein